MRDRRRCMPTGLLASADDGNAVLLPLLVLALSVPALTAGGPLPGSHARADVRTITRHQER